MTGGLSFYIRLPYHAKMFCFFILICHVHLVDLSESTDFGGLAIVVIGPFLRSLVFFDAGLCKYLGFNNQHPDGVTRSKVCCFFCCFFCVCTRLVEIFKVTRKWLQPVC